MIDFLLQDKVLFSAVPLAAYGISLILRGITDNYNEKGKKMKYHGRKIEWDVFFCWLFIFWIACGTAYYFFTGLYGLAVRVITAIGGLW